MTSEFVTEPEAAEQMGVAAVTLRLWRGRGVGPTHYRFGRLVKYKPADVAAWIEARRRESDPGRR